MNKTKNITILGSTGSIGVQALEVIEEKRDLFNVAYLTANSNIELVAEQIKKYNPLGVIVRNQDACEKLKRLVSFDGIITCGRESLVAAASDPVNDLVISSLVGFSGVEPTFAAIEQGIDVALANKETLVSAGSIITETAREKNVNIIAVDSEHSAILQCLIGEQHDEIEKLILTASGGPFLDTPIESFDSLNVGQALNHPNWSMGNKITIDSSTLMNKGFEVIEARWLFDIKPENIEVVIHPESIIHSMVQFIDGSVKAQIGLPSMKIPIAYALSYPHRLNYSFPRINMAEIGKLTFYEPDFLKFPCLRLAFEALEEGGTATSVLNAANEIAVAAFLKEKIAYTDIAKCIEDALDNIEKINDPDLDEIFYIDNKTRSYTKERIEEIIEGKL
jgi:1-deoxy-D-xylulose-5-phosphate reductoisomerase